MKILFSLCVLLLFLNDIQSQTIDVVTGLDSTRSLLVNEDELYYSYGNKISKINISDLIPIPIDVVTGLSNPTGMAIKDDNLYIAEFDAGKITKINMTETSPVPTDLVTGLNSPNRLLIIDNYLYFSDNNESKVYKLDLAQNTPVPIEVVSIFTGSSGPIGLTRNGDNLYISAGTGLDGKLYRIDITDSNPIAIEVLAGLNQPNGIRLMNSDVYTAEYGADKISKINVMDSSPISVDVITGLDKPSDIAFHAGDMFIIESTKISKVENLVLTLEEISLTKTYKLFPNPSTDFIQLSNMDHQLDYRILNLNGQEISTGYKLPGERINIEYLPSGTYIINLNNKMCIKFIKK